ncbi:O-antigen ligase family protein [Haladaptatus sp.]|uniref:O-antigen ligase family protein n=1 Tax=Haladaptatus sp. TaxID=1973141 RepID=UPI003C4D77CC
MSIRNQRTTSVSLNPLTDEFQPIALLQLLLIPLLFVAVLLRVPNAPEQYGSFHIDMLYLYLAPVLLLMYSYYNRDRNLWLHVAQVSVLILLTFVLLRQHNKYIPPDGRTFQVAFVFLLYVLYPILGHRLVEFVRSRALFIGAYSVLLGVYFYHVNEMSAGSTKASFVVYVALVFGLSLFFLPRYVNRDVFLWAVSLISAFAAVVGIPAYVVGDYQLSWLQIQLYHATFDLPLFGQTHFLQSIFSNPNTTGIVAFAGAFGALVLASDSVRYRRYVAASMAIPLLLLNVLALVLSYSRSSWLAFGLASVIYVGYLAFDRRSLPFTVVGLGVMTVLFIGGIFLSIVPIDTNGRFVLWKAGVQAVYHAPSPLGYGVVNTHDVIAPFISVERIRGHSPHNSYVEIFLQVGVVGGLAYLTLVGGSILEGIVRRDSVDVAMLAFAFGFAVHQLFEAYSLFNVAIGSVLSALVFGYLICGYRD